MSKKYDVLRFLLKCALIPGAAVLVILALNAPYRKIDEANYQDTLRFGGLGTVYWEIQIGNLGSSHGLNDFAYDHISERGYACFNFANTSQSYDYDYAILQEYGQYLSPGWSVLFIPVSYFSFNNEVTDAAEAQAMSIRYYHFLSPENIPHYDPYVDLVTHRAPILSAGEDILKLFPALPPALTAHAEGNGVDESAFRQMAAERYSRHFDNKDSYFLPERIEELYRIIAYCREHKITPVLITTPLSKCYLDLVPQTFLQEFQTTVRKIADDTDVSYYDYSHDERFYANLVHFSDADHLTEEGALFFTDILWDEVEELQRFH